MSARVALGCVALGYAVLQAVTGGLWVPLDLDEAVYASQFSGDTPRIPFAVHRSLGEGLLAAPVTSWTSDVTVIRVYFAALSAALLLLAFWPWTKVLDRAAAPAAAALFAVPWVSLRFGATVLPNMPVALGAVGAAGVLVVGGRRAWVPLLLIITGVGLLRPTDALWLALPLFAAAVVVPGWRWSAAGIAGGVAAGWGVWLVESFVRFGDPITRLRAIQSVNGASGLRFVLPRYLATLDGRESCPPTTVDCGTVGFATALWCAGGLALVGAGLWATRGEARRALLVSAATAVVFGGAYVVLSDLAVPRYLLPVFALLSLPAGAGLTAILRAARRRRAGQILAAAVLATALVHTGLQVAEADRASHRAKLALSWPVQAADALAARGVGGECAVLGGFAPQIAFLRRCHAPDMRDGFGARDASAAITAANVERLRTRGLRVALVTSRRPALPGPWQAVTVVGDGPRLYLSPSPARPAPEHPVSRP
ncbi:hypothetical protein [Spirillospora sp. CA-128828]|uniref:hypothetical protein n=1 Tax=Spirillospora sp. CA-128828 TaxID=3240033 RepID=UPI003D92D96F